MIVRELFAKLGLDVDEAGFIVAEKAIEGLQTSFLAFGTKVVGALALAAVGIAKTTADAGDSSRKMAQRFGVDSIVLQEFGYAASLADVSVEQLGRAMQFMAKRGVKDINKELLRISEQFAGMPDSAEKTRQALLLMGKGADALIPMLNGGSEELAAMAAEAHLLGTVISEEDQKASEEFNDELTRLMKTFVGLRNVIGLKLLKPIRLVSQAFRAWVLDIRRGGKALEEFTTQAKVLAAFLTGTFLASLILSSSGFAALGLSAVGAAIKAVIAWTAAAAPVVALGALLGLLILIIEDVYRFFAGKGRTVLGDFVAHVQREFGGWRGFFTALLDWITGTFNAFWAGLIAQALTAAFKIGQSFGPALKAAIGALPGGEILLRAGSAVTDAFGGGASPSASAASSPSRGPTVNAPQFKADITVNAAPGMSAQEVSNQVIMASDDWWNGKMRETAAGVE